jgi:putative ABC transport system permease protein
VFVVLQFAVSIALIVATLVVFQQLNFMRSKDLGFAGEQVVVIPLQNSPLKRNPEAFKNALLGHASVLGTSGANGTPGSGSSAASNYVLETPSGEKEIYLQTIYTDVDFIDTFGLKIQDGRDFSKEFGSDAAGGTYLLNQTAAKQMEWESPVGRGISRGGENPGRVIGVVEDFHYYSMRTRIGPIAINIKPSRIEYLAVRISGNDIPATLTFLEETWNRFASAYPFEHFFTNERFARFYRFEQRVGRLFALFAVLAVVISCLGVFGLISYTAEQSTKEIGVRKVLGAGVGGIVLLLTRRFVRWVLLANLIAWPLAWYVMFRWLQGFAYRVPFNVALFPLAGLLALAVALATVSYQAVKAALADPVRALRYE